jgi:hypothetical protein
VLQKAMNRITTALGGISAALATMEKVQLINQCRAAPKTEDFWRDMVVARAVYWFGRDVRDGTPEGDQIIGTEILYQATGKPYPEYRNGKKAWCGYFAQACYRYAGFNDAITLASSGKAECLFGRYLDDANNTSPTWSVLVTQDGPVVLPILDLHDQTGGRRQIGRCVDLPPLRGDLVLNDRDPGWNGHVMLALCDSGESGQVVVMEGNHSKTIGPDGKKRDGVGHRQMALENKYLDWTVRPAPADFNPCVTYHETRTQAHAHAAEVAEAIQ